jgi:hypothetical protein
MPSCFICLDTETASQSKMLVSTISHLINQHGWTNINKDNYKSKVSLYYWRFQFVSRCLELLKTSQTKEDYFAGISLISPFNPLFFPPGYSVDEPDVYKNSLYPHWKGEYERVSRHG